MVGRKKLIRCGIFDGCVELTALWNAPGQDTVDRLLPMQDGLQGGGLGNLIALPWQGKAMKLIIFQYINC